MAENDYQKLSTEKKLRVMLKWLQYSLEGYSELTLSLCGESAGLHLELAKIYMNNIEQSKKEEETQKLLYEAGIERGSQSSDQTQQIEALKNISQQNQRQISELAQSNAELVNQLKKPQLIPTYTPSFDPAPAYNPSAWQYKSIFHDYTVLTPNGQSQVTVIDDSP